MEVRAELFKSIFKGVFIAVVLLVVAAVAATMLVDLNSMKPWIENEVSKNIDKDFKINGDIKLVLFPSPSISLSDVQLSYAKGSIISVERVFVMPKLGPLLYKQVELSRVELLRPVIRLEAGKGAKTDRSQASKSASQKTAGASGETPPKQTLADKMVIKDGEFVVVGSDGKQTIVVRGINVDIRRVSIDKGAAGGEGDGFDFIRSLSLNGEVSVESSKINNMSATDINSGITLNGGVLELKPLTMEVFGSRTEGAGVVDFTGKMPRLNIKQTVRGLDLEKLFNELNDKKTMSGKADIFIDLSSSGRGGEEIKHNLYGSVLMKGKGLVLYDYDIDKILADYEKTQKYDLVDMGSLFIAGPFGPLLTKGYDVVGAYKGMAGGRSDITELISDWRVRGGVATARDVAFATKSNRIAIRGKMDFIRGEFRNFTVAVLDAGGCAKYRQAIHGSFDNPKVDKVAIVGQTIAGPVISLLKKAKKMVVKTNCRVFYSGSVSHPAVGVEGSK